MHSTFAYCLRNGVLGVGWRVPDLNHTTEWETYYEAASAIHENLNQCRYIQRCVSEGDLVWTRSPPPCRYYLARVLSGWEYWNSEEARNADIDVANLFRCEIEPIQIDDVPGKVINCFRAQRSIQEIADTGALEYSKALWNRLSGRQIYSINPHLFADIFMMLGPEETEDLLFLYLQSLGWFVVPNSRKADTMSFEYLVVRPKTGERALTQVKTGNAILNLNEYKNVIEKVFVFQSNGFYSGQADNVTRIERNELLDFLTASRDWLPGIFDKKMKMLEMSKPFS